MGVLLGTGRLPHPVDGPALSASSWVPFALVLSQEAVGIYDAWVNQPHV